MSKIQQLQLRHFRNIDQACLAFGDGLNVIVGDNAAGKTALIEAIWVLASGRSFRTAKPEHLIQRGQTETVLFCEVSDGERAHKIGLSRAADKVTLKVDGETLRNQAEMAAKLPVQLLTPESHRLLEEGPKARRQFMDWGCFHHDADFIHLWRTYRRALKQRNHALKRKLPANQARLWDQQLIDTAERIDRIRAAYITDLTPYLVEFCQALMPEISVQPACHYQPGWPKSADSYTQLLDEHYPKDALQGHTQYGSHRADIKFRFDGQDAMMTLSRGQQKLFVCALLLAQASLYEKHSGKPVIMLIDDLPAELDAKHRETLLKLLDLLHIQHILTSTADDLIPILNPETARRWHIDNGGISAETRT
ncbi:DNA replication/repair protein RecF [Hydrogenovibrio thermophilus]|uniref:DNA replication and repair protein RecF n=1 Tax=Hydrogenovibrio thermophilus TaxID=265883 RepID=A0A451G3Y9_9GAMM|nr:DNA replication/repair protein RecF [Hydrogenovibrio thermophilus]QAB14167.1 DNA replication/repair protein RecF [Hydrogenovibrio thermophilus]